MIDLEYKKIYESWLNDPNIDKDTKKELTEIKNKDSEIRDRFSKYLEFGTAGLRGKLGAGTNRMNRYMVGMVTQALSQYICKFGGDAKKRGVAIAYDCRHFSEDFAKEAALILASNGIKTYLFDKLRPTPELSYAVRELNCISGIVVTASHNPKDYNGYKVYWEDGAQILPSIADKIKSELKKIKDFSQFSPMDEKDALKKKLLVYLDEKMDRSYLDKVLSLTLNDKNLDKSLSIVYTPLNGAGTNLVPQILKERGFKNLHVVPEQKKPDGDFPTVDYPNPEDNRAFALSEKLGKKTQSELLIATDPDCDRLAIEVLDGSGKYVPFNGNQIGALLIEYILQSRNEKETLPEKGAIVKSIVTGDLGKAIGEKYGMDTYEAFTGFKNICGKIPELERKNIEFIFGYEESIGFSAGEFVRDKDGVSSAMLLCEAAAYYKAKGKTLLDIMDAIYQEHGYYREKQLSIVLEGIEGSERIQRMMKGYRLSYPKKIGKLKLKDCQDFLMDIPNFTKADVLRFFFDDGSWYALRPSGTEPKIKLYIYSKGDNLKEVEKKISSMEKEIKERLDAIE